MCQDYSIPVSVTSQVLIPNYPRFSDDFDVVDFVNTLLSRDAKASFVPFCRVKNVTALYEIAATICSPCKNTRKEKTLLLASHGLGYDRRYVARLRLWI